MLRIRSRQQKQNLLAYLFLTPATLTVLVIIIYPLYVALDLSFRKVRMFQLDMRHTTPISIANYSKMFHSPYFWNSLRVTLAYTVVGVAGALILGMITALLLNKDFRGRQVARLAILLPWAIPGVVATIIATWLFDSSYGVINYILQSLGIISSNVAWLTRARTAFAAVSATTIWKSYPFFTLMLLAGLQAIPKELNEAAVVDGANAYQRFAYITLPALRHVIVIATILNGLWIFKQFEIIYVMTGGGPARATETLAIQIYQEAFKFFNMGYASAIGIFTLLAAMVGVSAMLRLSAKEFY
jgi:multiple sugar transport system permease protein